MRTFGNASAAMPSPLESSTMLYQPFYCEENIFHLAHDARFADRDPVAVFLLGSAQGVAMWRQRAGSPPHGHIVWDYHVVLLVRAPWEIWDLDTTLGCPLPAERYFTESFRPLLTAPPKVRLVAAAELLSTFASDRSHMIRSDGTFYEPPPPWPPLGREGVTPNLRRFLDASDRVAGKVIDLTTLMAQVAVEDASTIEGDAR